MPLNPLSDGKIIDSWNKNASAWAIAVQQAQIESRKLVTDQAIVEAVCHQSPQCVLDLGCGEGWLARRLAAVGIAVWGVDAVPELIAQAEASGGGQFQVLSYETLAIAEQPLFPQQFDVVVANFSLLGKEAVTSLFTAITKLLRPQACLIVQTLHPLIACGEQPYQDGWREGSWAGFSDAFSDPAPWYFRRLESWIRLFVDSGFVLEELREPIHPHTEKPASVIFIARSKVSEPAE